MTEIDKPASEPGSRGGDTIDIFDLFHTLIKYKIVIGLVTALALLAGGYKAMKLPKLYKAELLMKPSKLYGTKGGAGLSQGLGGIGSLMGLSIGGEQDDETKINLVVIKSRPFALWMVNHNPNLKNVLFPLGTKGIPIPDLNEGAAGTVLGASSVKSMGDGTLRLTVTHEDPKIAYLLANMIFDSINEYTRTMEINRARTAIDFVERQIEKTPVLETRQVLFSIISDKTKRMVLAQTQTDYAFEMIDPPVLPQGPENSKAKMILVSSLLAGGMAGLLGVAVYRVFRGLPPLVKRTGSESAWV